MVKKYFRQYLKIAPFSHALWRALEAEKVQSIKKESPILDIGCGFGEFAGAIFTEMLEMGIDVNPKDLKLAKGKNSYNKLLLADARNLPFEKDTFPTVISISTLEHIEKVEKVFPEVFRVLRKGGKFVFTVPTRVLNDSLKVPKILRAYKLDLFAEKYLQLFHRAFKHKVIVSKGEWLKMTKKTGFKIVSCTNLISNKQVEAFENGLFTAMFTQVSKTLFNKRLVVSPKSRIERMLKKYSNLLKDDNRGESNIMIVCRK